MSELISCTEFPLVSVIIPAFNASKYISATIESVLLQTYPNVEIIVIDDGSTDDTETKVSVYKNNITYYYQNNSGVSAARNAGILKSRGEFVTCIDADDIMHREKVSNQVAFIKKNTHVPIVFTDYTNFTGHNRIEISHFKSCKKLMAALIPNYKDSILKSEEALNILVEENFTIGGTPLFSRNSLNKVGLYDESLSQGEDFELHYRFAKHYPIGIINKVMLFRRLHEENATKKMYKLCQKAGMSRQIILLYEEDKILRKKIKLWLQELYLSLGYNEISQNKTMRFLMTLYSLKYGFNAKLFTNICRIVTK